MSFIYSSGATIQKNEAEKNIAVISGRENLLTLEAKNHGYSLDDFVKVTETKNCDGHYSVCEVIDENTITLFSDNIINLKSSRSGKISRGDNGVPVGLRGLS